MKTTYRLESRLSNTPNTWSSKSYTTFNSLADINKFLQDCLERQKENAEINFKISGIKVLDYRIVETNSTTTEKVLSVHTVDPPEYNQRKSDELHYLDQIYKYMKHLEYLYISNKEKDADKLWQIKISLSNVDNQRTSLREEIKVNYLDTWRIFDQS